LSENAPLRWRLLGRVVLFVLACAFVLAAMSPLTRQLPGRWSDLALGTVAGLGAFALTALFVRWERLRLEDVGAEPAWRSLPRFGFGFLIGSLLIALSASVSVAVAHVRWARVPGVGSAGTMVTLLTYVVLSCREELGFRGYPLRRLERSFGLWGAQIIVALLFAGEHMAGGWPWDRALLGAGVGSLLFGMASIATRGLAVPIGLHTAWNFGDWMLGGKGSRGLWVMVVPEGQQGRAEVVRTIGYLAVMGSATLAFWIWHRGTNRTRSIEEYGK
jgi:membrane protease YdiL (CAAX protease family)